MEGCSAEGTEISRLSPQGYMVSTGKPPYSLEMAYQKFTYCKCCHIKLRALVWDRVMKSAW